MAECKKKQFDSEWEAKAWIIDHPWPEPSPPLFVKQCFNCGKLHISVNRNGKKKKRNGK